MTTLTEGKHNSEFLLSEENGTLSREQAAVASGQDKAETKAGRVVKDNGSGKLIVAAGTNAGGVSSENIVGVLLDNIDASGGDVDAAYIARDAELKASAVRLHAVTGGGEANATTAVTNKLKSLGIILR